MEADEDDDVVLLKPVGMDSSSTAAPALEARRSPSMGPRPRRSKAAQGGEALAEPSVATNATAKRARRVDASDVDAEVDKIIGERFDAQGNSSYHILWSDGTSTWEPASNANNCYV